MDYSLLLGIHNMDQALRESVSYLVVYVCLSLRVPCHEKFRNEDSNVNSSLDQQTVSKRESPKHCFPFSFFSLILCSLSPDSFHLFSFMFSFLL